MRQTTEEGPWRNGSESSNWAPAWRPRTRRSSWADAGADVVKVESAGGDPARERGPFPDGGPDPERSGVFLALNLNKRGITLDVASERGELDRLLAWADLLIHDLRASAAAVAGLDAVALRTAHPNLVTLAVTPFGQTGPYAEYEAEELTVANAGGWAYVCPATSTDPSLPPLKVFGDQCALMSGIAGATAALAAAREARRSGVGEYIDLSEQAYVASVLEGGLPMYEYMGQVMARHHKRMLIPWRIFDAEDGPVFLVCVEQDQWERLVEFMGHPDWADLPTFAGQAERAENEDMVHLFVQEFVGTWRAHEFYHQGQAHRICIAPVMSLRDLAENEHLRARGFFVEVGEGDARMEYLAPAALTKSGRAAIRRPAPRLGGHNGTIDIAPRPARPARGEPRPPLAGIRVLDLTWAWAGPFCTMNLAHLGAEVIRIESAKRADLYRRLRIRDDEWGDDLDTSGMFNQWNQGKASVSVDLGHRRRHRDRQAARGRERRGGAELRHGRHGAAWPWLRHPARHQSPHHPGQHHRLRPDRALPPLHGLRPRHAAADGAVDGHGIRRRWTGGVRALDAGSNRRDHGGDERRLGAAQARRDRRWATTST